MSFKINFVFLKYVKIISKLYKNALKYVKIILKQIYVAKWNQKKNLILLRDMVQL